MRNDLVVVRRGGFREVKSRMRFLALNIKTGMCYAHLTNSLGYLSSARFYCLRDKRERVIVHRYSFGLSSGSRIRVS
jgi:hypothetical protein